MIDDADQSEVDQAIEELEREQVRETSVQIELDEGPDELAIFGTTDDEWVAAWGDSFTDLEEMR